MMRVVNILLLGGLLSFVVAISAWAQSDTQTPSLTTEPLVLTQSPISLDVAGTVSFGVRYGFGDGRGLAQKGYSHGFQFNQLLALNIDGDMPITLPFLELDGLFSISAQLNSQQADNLQSLAMHFESEHLLLDFGDFFVGENAPLFIVPDRKLKGFKAQGLWDGLTVTGAFARVEGIAESKTFRGNTSSETVVFSVFQADRPWLEEPYLRNLAGLEYYLLPIDFIEGFTRVELNLNPGMELEILLESYALSYLFPDIEAQGPTELDEALFEIVRNDGETYLILKRESFNLLRSRLRQLIDDYNLDQQLQGEDRKTYPFNEETDFELGFLEQLQALVTLDLDEAQLSLGDYEQRRFFFLGYEEIDPDSLKVEITVGEEFIDLTDPQLLGFEQTLFEEQGLIDLQFPSDFFENDQNQIRASYNYTSTSGIYILGLSIVKGSDRVFLNGTPLQRDVDYTIDYETGALILFKEVSKEDVLRIEYEVLRGGLGGFAEYQRNLSQLSINLNPVSWFNVNLDLLQGADINSGEDRSRLRTMPNTHTVAGIRIQANLSPLEVSLALGYNINAHPLDNNLRINFPNQINDIQSLEYGGKSFTLFSHKNGLTVFDGVRWTLYDTRSGLSGRTVYDIAISSDWIALATESGLTLIRLEGDDPFALISNWKRFYQQDGLADNQVFAVAFDENWLWLGTRDGFSKVDTNVDLLAFEASENWISYQQEQIDALLSPSITHLLAVRGLVYLGSEGGLQIFDPFDEQLQTDAALLGGAVHDIAVSDDTVYVASDWGLRTLVGYRGSGWLASGEPIFAVAADENEIWYAPERGVGTLGLSSVPRELKDVAVRALAFQNKGVWAGPIGGEPPRYPLNLTYVTANDVRTFNNVTTRIDGRDLHRFRDAPLLDEEADQDQLDLGWLGQLELRYRVGNFSLRGGIEGISPEYTAIGNFVREDYLRWRLRSDYIVSPDLIVFAEHISGLGSPLVTDNVGLTWKAGPQLALTYSEEKSLRQNQTKANFSFDLSDKYLEDTLRVRFKLDDEGTRSLRSNSRSQDLTISGLVDFEPNDVLSFEFDFKSPLHLRTRQDLRGSLQVGGGASWAPQVGFGTLRFSYDFDQDIRFSQRGDSTDHDFEASMNWQPFNWMDALLTPQSSISFRQRSAGFRDQSTTLALNNSVQTRWEQFSAQLRWNRDQGHNQIIQTEEIRDALSLRVDFRGFETLSPGVDWSINTVELKHATRQNKFFLTQRLSVRLGWTPDTQLNVNTSVSADFSNSEKENTVSYSAQSTTTYQLLDTVNVSFALSGNWDKGVREDELVNNLSFDGNFQGDWQFSEDWTATFAAGVLYGQDAVTPSNDYLSYIASINASMNF